MSNEQTFLLPRLELGDRVFLVFHPARARLASLQPLPDTLGLVRLPAQELPPNVVGLHASAKESSGEVQVLASQPPLELVKYVVLRRDEVLEAPAPVGDKLADLRPAREPIARLLLQTSGYLSELWTILNATPDIPLWRYRRFFSDLDRHTDDSLRREYLANTPLLDVMDAAIPVVMATLGDCIGRRAKDETHGYRCPSYPGASIVLAELQAVSDVFLSLLFKYFRVAGRGLDLDAVEDAFEMFANGELRLRLPSMAWACQPSSGMYFYFAEFALVCAGAGIEPGLWGRLANVMVRTQRMYCIVYRPSDPPPWNLYHYKADNHDPSQTFTGAEKAMHEQAFRGKSREELAIAQAAHIEEFAPDEVDEAITSHPRVGLPQPAPSPRPPARLPDRIAP